MTAAFVLGGIGLSLALLLSLAKRLLASREAGSAEEVVDAIDALLPQSQCAQCGYPGCRPYAQAVADGERLDLCPPGGPETVTKLKSLLGRESESASSPARGNTSARPGVAAPAQMARIVAKDCIGCALCLDACPVDAIVGAPTYLHAVIEEHCTGCELCLPPCPVDCIELVEPQSREPAPCPSSE